MATYLALRKTDADGALKRLFSIATRWRLMTRYPHAGIVIKDPHDGDYLLHTTASEGMHISAYDPSKWFLVPVDVSDDEVKSRFSSVKSAKYDWVSQIAFLVPFRVTKADWLYCYEWAYFAITGIIYPGRVTPEMLLVAALETRNGA